jgi:Xaa-Pro dipeptidase
MPAKNELPFSREEYAGRLDKVRREMQRAGIDVILTTTPENIAYLTGYHTLGYFTYQILIVSLDHGPILLTRALNIGKAQVDSMLENIEGYKDTEDPNDATYNTLAKYKLLAKRIANQDDAWFFSVSRYKKLIERLGVKDFVDCSGLIEKVRRIKSPKEIEYIRVAGRYCEESFREALGPIKPGVLETEISAAAHYGMHKAGSEYLGHSLQIVAGKAAGLGFECAMRRPIEKNDVIYMEMGGTHNRYNCMLSRTVIVGKPGQRWIDMYNASRDGLNAAKAKIKPGAVSHDVDRAARDVINKAGFGTYFMHRTGYSIGIGFPPDWGEGRIMSLNENDPTVLEAGMCFHLIPDLKGLDDGGVVCSESLVVTDTGYRLLTDYPQDLVYK